MVVMVVGVDETIGSKIDLGEKLGSGSNDGSGEVLTIWVSISVLSSFSA